MAVKPDGNKQRTFTRNFRQPDKVKKGLSVHAAALCIRAAPIDKVFRYICRDDSNFSDAAGVNGMYYFLDSTEVR